MTPGPPSAPARIELGRADLPTVVFAHGWDRHGEDFRPVAELIADRAHAVLLDLPGFGASPRPEASWGTEDYARYLREHIGDELGCSSFIWVGHSFGGRIGLRLAAVADSPVSDLVIVAGAGLKRPRSWWETVRARARSQWFRLRRRPGMSEADLIALERQFGSADYVRSRETGLRDIFLNTVNEDQSDSVVGQRMARTLSD
ncbi:MAG: alpha/beta fold hydrolase [Pseudomonadota bacterium]